MEYFSKPTSDPNLKVIRTCLLCQIMGWIYFNGPIFWIFCIKVTNKYKFLQKTFLLKNYSTIWEHFSLSQGRKQFVTGKNANPPFVVTTIFGFSRISIYLKVYNLALLNGGVRKSSTRDLPFSLNNYLIGINQAFPTIKQSFAFALSKDFKSCSGSVAGFSIIKWISIVVDHFVTIW